MRVLIACEFSGVVRDAFLVQGHDAWSCDIIPTERPGPHIINDVRNVLDWNWDLMIAHPPCTYLARVSAPYWKNPRRNDLAKEALNFVELLMKAPIPKIAIENPYGKAWDIRRPDQIIHPWQFGHNTTKATCLWLMGLPPLMATLIIWPKPRAVWRGNTARNRSRTYPGIAAAMASQWGHVA